MIAMIDDSTAAILAGGLGTRLGGASKAFLEVGGRTILARQLAVLRPLFFEILVVAADPEPYAGLGVRTVVDLFAGKGAPGGVHAALAAASTGWVFCLACDMPFVRPEAIELLAGRRAGAQAVVPLRGGFLEPLFAFWSKSLEGPLSAALGAGNPSLALVLEAAGAARVTEAELAAIDPGCRSLENVNTLEDLARARG